MDIMRRMSRKRRHGNKIEGRNWKIRLLLWLLISKTQEIEKRQNFRQSSQLESLDTRTSMTSSIIIDQYRKMIIESRGTGTENNCFLMDGRRQCVRKIILLQSNKIRNKNIKMKNGNGTLRQNISVIHWNMGAKFWERKKLEVEAVLFQFNPDIFIISEANMKLDLTDEEKRVNGYYMLLQILYKYRIMLDL